MPTLPIGSHRPKISNKWDEDDLSESDIHQLTAQMQMSFKPKENTNSEENDVEYCKGQYCYRCGSYVNECEGTCSVCGTHCKRPDAPCKVCRDTCERCGKPKVRCESRDQGQVASEQEEELQANGIGEQFVLAPFYMYLWIVVMTSWQPCWMTSSVFSFPTWRPFHLHSILDTFDIYVFSFLFLR